MKRYTMEDYDIAIAIKKKQNKMKMNIGNAVLYGVPVLIAIGIIVASRVF